MICKERTLPAPEPAETTIVDCNAGENREPPMGISALCSISNQSSHTGNKGFTLLEVMISVAIIAIALTVLIGSQSQSVSLANESKFGTTAALLAQKKMAELELAGFQDAINDQGDFGEEYPGYQWKFEVRDFSSGEFESVAEQLVRVDLTLSLGDESQFQYVLRSCFFVPAAER